MLIDATMRYVSDMIFFYIVSTYVTLLNATHVCWMGINHGLEGYWNDEAFMFLWSVHDYTVPGHVSD